MKGLLIPAVIALTLHCVVLFSGFNAVDKRPVVKPEIRFMSMNLSVKQSAVEKKRKEILPHKKKKRPVRKSIVNKKEPVRKNKPDLKTDRIDEPEPKTSDIVDTESVETRNEPVKDSAEPSEGATSLIREAYPLYHYNPSPSYPRTARLRGWQGVVQLEVLVDRYGKVKELEIRQSSGYSLLDKSALKAVKTWQFEPGMKGGEPIEMTVTVPIRFRLDHA